MTGYRAIEVALDALAAWLEDGLTSGKPTKYLANQAAVAVRYIAGLAGQAAAGEPVDIARELAFLLSEPAPGEWDR